MSEALTRNRTPPPALMTNSNLTSFKCQVSQRPMRAEEAGSIVHQLPVNYKTPIGSRNNVLKSMPITST